MHFSNTLPEGFCVLADNAYNDVHENLVAMFREFTLNILQHEFNRNAANIRNLVERVLGASKIIWRTQQGKENRIAAVKGVDFAWKYIYLLCCSS